MVKNLPAKAGDAGRHGFNPWVGKIALEKEMATHSQSSCLEHPMDRGAWRATVHGVAQSRTRLTMHTHVHTRAHTHTHTSHLLFLSPFLDLSISISCFEISRIESRSREVFQKQSGHFIF